MESQISENQKQVKLGLYFVNEIKGVTLDVAISYGISTTGKQLINFRITLRSVQHRREILVGFRKITQA